MRSPAAALCAVAVALVVAVGGGLFVACPGDTVLTRCDNDRDCDPSGLGFNRCDVGEGVCLCADDRGCGAGETCNALGFCQTESGCNSNDECSGGTFCDITTAQCLSVQECGAGKDCCTLDSQCGFGNVCDRLSLSCVPGCRDNADCILGDACVRTFGQALGQCAAGVCSNDNLCKFGEVCTADGSCARDTRGPYCLGCSGGVASNDCGRKGNFCLTDSVNGGEFCGVDCASGEACPFGYTCNNVIIIPPAAPFCSAEVCQFQPGQQVGRCSRNGNISCRQDQDCPIGFPGGDCPGAQVGNCAREQLRSCSSSAECGDGDECLTQQCRFREGAAFGFCSCTKDTDCPRDRCTNINPQTSEGNCELSGRRCFDDADCEAVISCFNGGCFIGKNCAPGNDRTCRDLLVSPDGG
jgi:hypothetical protein